MGGGADGGLGAGRSGLVPCPPPRLPGLCDPLVPACGSLGEHPGAAGGFDLIGELDPSRAMPEEEKPAAGREAKGRKLTRLDHVYSAEEEDRPE